MSVDSSSLLPLVFYGIGTLFVVSGMVAVSYLLGERHKERATNEPYESGMPLTGPARTRMDVKYYLIAMFFVIFDLEAVFLLAWAVSVKEAGWMGYVEALIFTGILLVALIYLWRSNALDWSASGQGAHTKGPVKTP